MTTRPNRKSRAQESTARPAKRGGGDLDALLTSKHMHWTTPEPVLRRLNLIGRPALDPCSNFASRTGALREWWGRVIVGQALLEQARAEGRHVELRDGLAESWQGFVSFVYVNSPYGKELPDWLKKCADEAALGAEVIGLMPARTDTVAMHEQVFQRAAAGCFWRGRIQFGNPPPDSKSPGSTFPSFVAYHGRRVDEFFAAFDGAGELVRLNTPRHQEDDNGER